MRRAAIVTYLIFANFGAQSPRAIAEASPCARCQIVVRETIELAEEQDSSGFAPVTVRERARGQGIG